MKEMTRLDLGVNGIHSLPACVIAEAGHVFELSTLDIKLYSRGVGLLQFEISMKAQPESGAYM